MKKNTLKLIITALVVSNIFSLYKLNKLENHMNDQFQQYISVNNGLRSEIGNIYSNVEARLKKQASILDNHNVAFGEINSSNFTVPVTFSVTPKEFSKGLTASMQVNDRTIGMNNEGTSFIVTENISVFDDFKLKVILEQNGVKKVETIEEYYGLRDKFLLSIGGGFNGQSSYGSNQYSYNGTIDFHFQSQKSNTAESASIINEVNGKVVDEQNIDILKTPVIKVNKNIKLAAGDKLIVYAVVKDSYGLNYKYAVNVFEVGSNGSPVEGNHGWEVRRLMEISDKNGKVLYTPKDEFGGKY